MKSFLLAKKDLESYSSDDIKTMAAFYNINTSKHKYDDLLWRIAVKNLSSYTRADMPIAMNNHCRNSVDPATFDDDPDTIFTTRAGICWDTESLARYIISRNGDLKFDDQLATTAGCDIGKKTYKPTKLDDDDIEQLLESNNLSTELKQQLANAIYPDLINLPESLMALILNTGQILQNVGPAWDTVIQEKMTPELREAWDAVKNTTSMYEPPEGMTELLADTVMSIKAEAFNEFYNVWATQPDNVKDAIAKLNTNLREERLGLCRSGHECLKIISVALLQAYNKWAKVAGKPVYDYEAELRATTRGRGVGWNEYSIPSPRVRSPTSVKTSAKKRAEIVAKRAQRLIPRNAVENNSDEESDDPVDDIIARYESGTTDFTGLRIINPDFRGEDLHGADFSHTFFSGANFNQCNLQNVNFIDAVLDGANFNDIMGETSDFTQATCTNCLFITADLTNCVFRAADLTNANFSDAVLIGANFEDAILRNAYLAGVGGAGADLQEADLTGAYLQEADFTGADFTGANFTRADLQGAVFNADPGSTQAAKFISANFTRANLTNAIFTECDLYHANFTDANLTNANFIGATLVYTDFTGANLANANLAGANLANANLAGANLAGAIIRDVRVNTLQH